MINKPDADSEFRFKGAIGALLAIEPTALTMYTSAAYEAVGFSEGEALAQAKEFIGGFRLFAKSEGIANA